MVDLCHEIYILEMKELGDILNNRRKFVKFYPEKNEDLSFNM